MVLNCAIVGCTTNSGKCPSLTYHAVSKPLNKPWEQQLIKIINRSDKVFNPKYALICSRHFDQDCYQSEYDIGEKRRLKEGSLPTKFLAERHHCHPVTERKPPANRVFVEPPEKTIAMSDLVANSVRCTRWQVLKSTNSTDFVLYKNHKVTRCVEVSPTFGISVYLDRMLADLDIKLSSDDISSVLERVEDLAACEGIQDPTVTKKAPEQTSLSYKNTIYNHETDALVSAIYSKHCTKVADTNSLCNRCSGIYKRLQNNRKEESTTISKYTPLASASHVVLANALRTQRHLSRKLQRQVVQLQKKIETESTPIPTSLHRSFSSVLDSHNLTDPLTKLFWAEQKKAFATSKTGMRWHPDLIRLAILVHSQSAAAYKTLKETGVLRLPGETTLRDYTNVISPSQGFQPEVVSELQTLTKNLPATQRWVALLHDEMSIKSNLIYNERSGEAVGFIYGDDNVVATHVLVFMVVGVNPSSSLKFSLGYFGTKNATADILYPLFWEAIMHLETRCNLKVIVSTSDKASPNQRLIDLNHGYKTMNIFAPDRNIYFVSDPPHLMKTVCNILNNSGANLNSRYLWNNGKHLLWSHIREVYKVDSERELRRTKLTYDHIYPDAFSRMKVNLAVQVLSRSVATILRDTHPEDAEEQETAKFVLLMDRMFDCLNVRSTQEGVRQRKPDVLPYTTINDPRFAFLTDEVLGYLRKWYDSVQNRPNFTKKEKQKMFLSHQTYKGIVTTINSVVEATQFLLEQGVPSVHTNRFCQDPLEAHFGRQRGLGRRSENPTLHAYGYNENKLRIQRSIALNLQPKGSVQRKRRAAISRETDNTPLKRRK